MDIEWVPPTRTNEVPMTKKWKSPIIKVKEKKSWEKTPFQKREKRNDSIQLTKEYRTQHVPPSVCLVT